MESPEPWTEMSSLNFQVFWSGINYFCNRCYCNTFTCTSLLFALTMQRSQQKRTRDRFCTYISKLNCPKVVSLYFNINHVGLFYKKSSSLFTCLPPLILFHLVTSHNLLNRQPSDLHSESLMGFTVLHAFLSDMVWTSDFHRFFKTTLQTGTTLSKDHRMTLCLHKVLLVINNPINLLGFHHFDLRNISTTDVKKTIKIENSTTLKFNMSIKNMRMPVDILSAPTPAALREETKSARISSGPFHKPAQIETDLE